MFANVRKRGRLSISGWKLGHPSCQLVDLHALHRLCLRAWRMVGLAAVQLDDAGFHAPNPVPDHVDRDLVQPGPLFQLAEAFRRIGGKRAVRTQEGVLSHLLRIVAYAGDGPAHPEHPAMASPGTYSAATAHTLHLASLNHTV